MNKSDVIDSGISYTVGGGLIYLSHVAEYVQTTTLVLGCLIGGIRLIYEIVRLYRYIRKEK